MFPFRLIADLRPASPWSIYAAPVYRKSDRPVEHRFAIRWDEDNDERVLAAVQALYYQSSREFRFCHGFGEHKGTLAVWHYDFKQDVGTAVDRALNGLAGLLGDLWTFKLINNYLPPLDLTSHIRAALNLSVADKTAAVKQALLLLAPSDSDAAHAIMPILGYKAEHQAGIDDELAALHSLFHLGSFGKIDREWT